MLFLGQKENFHCPQRDSLSLVVVVLAAAKFSAGLYKHCPRDDVAEKEKQVLKELRSFDLFEERQRKEQAGGSTLVHIILWRRQKRLSLLLVNIHNRVEWYTTYMHNYEDVTSVDVDQFYTQWQLVLATITAIRELIIFQK